MWARATSRRPGVDSLASDGTCVRVLLTTDDARLTAQTLAQSTGYAKRNVHDALTGLTIAGVVSAVAVRAGQRYAADRAAWAALLGISPPTGAWENLDEVVVDRSLAMLDAR